MRAYEFIDPLAEFIQRIIECDQGPWTIVESDSNFVVQYSSLFNDSIKNKPRKILDRLPLFIETKKENPNASFGKSDTPFISAGPLGILVPKLRHAHLSQDISVLYKIEGSKPTVLKIYGLWSHQESGTGNAANIKTQKQLAMKIKNSDTA